jgi:hypothetical protein
LIYFLNSNKGEDQMKIQFKTLSVLLVVGPIVLWFMLSSTMVAAGTFVYDQTPAFSISFPDEFQESEDKGTSVYKARGNTTSFTISVSDLKEEAKLEEGAEYYARSLQKKAKEGTEVKITYAEKKQLKDGTPVMEFEITWQTQGGTPLVTQAIMVFKKQKLITLGFHNWGEPIGTAPLYTLTFK